VKKNSQVSQRDLMRMLYVQHSGSRERIIAAYSKSEDSGRVVRKKNSHDISPAEYGAALLNDGLRKGWL